MRGRSSEMGLRIANLSLGFCLAVTLVPLLAGTATGQAAPDIVDTVRLEEGAVRTALGPDGCEQVSVEGLVTRSATGEPMVPTAGRTYLVPDGMRVSRVEVIESSRSEMDGEHPLMPGGTFEAIARGTTQAMNVELLGSTREYPGSLVELTAQGWMRGHRVATVAVHPVQYRPADRRLILYPEISYRLVLEPDPDPVETRRLRASEEGWKTDRRLLANTVVNWSDGAAEMPRASEASGGFSPTDMPSLDGSLVEYLIITTDALAPAFERLAEWKTRCGVPAEVRTVSWIRNHYTGGVDVQEKIRDFIRDAYQKWGTLWVVIGGEEAAIPSRLAHCDYYGGGNWLIPSDLYYECLDGNWNADGDDRFAEGYKSIVDQGDQADFYSEVAVGRVPAETADEVNLFIDHLLEYQSPDSVGYQTRALFVGEVVFPIWWEPGQPIYLNGKDCCMQGIRNLPANWDTTTLFEYPDDTESRESVLAALNEGYGLIAYVSHGDAFKMSTADERFIYASDVDALTNGAKRGIKFDLNCHLSQTEVECMNERFLFNSEGGLIAPLGCTHYDFPHVGQYYLGEFTRLMFQSDLSRVGELNVAHKLPFMGESISDVSAFRWTALTYVLLGDPEMAVWTELPESLSVAHAGTVGIGGGSYLLEVTAGGVPVEGATVCFWKEDGDYARGLTDAAGQVTLELDAMSLGTGSLVVTKRNYFPAVDSVEVTGAGARVFVESVEIDDDAVAPSSGNGDGIWDAGETVEITVTLKNGGAAAATGVEANLGLPSGSTLTADLTLDGGERPNRVLLGRNEFHPAAIPFTVDLSGDSLWGRPTFDACADTAIYLWEDAAGWHLRGSGGLVAHTFAGTLSTDGAFGSAKPYRLEDGDVLDLDETLTFDFSVDSTECEDGADFLAADSAFVDILDTTAVYGTIPAGASVEGTFVVRADRDARDQDQVRFLVDVRDDARGQWVGGFREELAAPILSDHFHTLDDRTGGNGNWIPETGETVLIKCRIVNDGMAAAPAVQGRLRAIDKVVVLDSTAVFGNIAGGALVEATDTFSVQITGTPPKVRLELKDSRGRVWREDWELVPPSVPTGITGRGYGPGRNWVNWTPHTGSDFVGYNLYCEKEGIYVLTRLNGRILEDVAYFDHTGLLPLTRYWYEVAAVDTSGNESPHTPLSGIWTNPNELAGWPQLTDNVIYSSPAVADLDLDGDNEVVVGSKDWRVWAWDAHGSLLPGWPRSTGEEVWSSPTLVDLDMDPELEILIGSSDGKIYAWNLDGTGLLQPSGVFANPGAIVRSTAAVADVDGDVHREIFITSGHRLMAYRENGTGYLQPDGLFMDLGSGEAGASPTLADLDEDGDMEVIIGRPAGDLYVWHHDGTGFTSPTGFFADTGPIWASASVADLQNDGNLEIVLPDLSNNVYVWDTGGVLLPGWPKTTINANNSCPALGDLDNDGDLEIVLGSNDGYVWAWHHTGAGVYQANGILRYLGGETWSSPALADLDGNGDLEVVIGSSLCDLAGIHHDGKLLRGFPVRLSGAVYGSPTIADVDKNGDIEIVVGAYDAGLHVYDLTATLDPNKTPWPMFRHDINRTGLFGFVDTLTPVADEDASPLRPLVTALDQNYPNPCNPRTTVSFSLATAGRVEVVLYNVLGQRVRTLVEESLAAGPYKVEWDGTDVRGRAVSSGVYFCKMTADGRDFTRKVIMLQ